MVAVIQLIRLHFGRAISSRWVQICGLCIVICICGLESSGVQTPKPAAYLTIFAFAAVVSVAQAAADKVSGLTDGIRTTPSSDLAAFTARLMVIPSIAILYVLLLLVASRILSVIR